MQWSAQLSVPLAGYQLEHSFFIPESPQLAKYTVLYSELQGLYARKHDLASI